MTPGLKAVLEELKKLQEELGISSEFVLCHEDGEWIKTDAYGNCITKIDAIYGAECHEQSRLPKEFELECADPYGLQ